MPIDDPQPWQRRVFKVPRIDRVQCLVAFVYRDDNDNDTANEDPAAAAAVDGDDSPSSSLPATQQKVVVAAPSSSSSSGPVSAVAGARRGAAQSLGEPGAAQFLPGATGDDDNDHAALRHVRLGLLQDKLEREHARLCRKRARDAEAARHTAAGAGAEDSDAALAAAVAALPVTVNRRYVFPQGPPGDAVYEANDVLAAVPTISSASRHRARKDVRHSWSQRLLEHSSRTRLYAPD